MAPYVDTGILVKSNVSERNSHEADVLLFGTLPPLPLTHFQELEIRNAMRLKRGRGELSQLELEQSLRDFQETLMQADSSVPFTMSTLFFGAPRIFRPGTRPRPRRGV